MTGVLVFFTNYCILIFQTEPVKGVQQEGFEGLVKGIGRGVVGVVVKPAVGVLDFASQTATVTTFFPPMLTCQGIRNTASFFESKSHRIRQPRFIPAFGEIGYINTRFCTTQS